MRAVVFPVVCCSAMQPWSDYSSVRKVFLTSDQDCVLGWQATGKSNCVLYWMALNGMSWYEMKGDDM